LHRGILKCPKRKIKERTTNEMVMAGILEAKQRKILLKGLPDIGEREC
jgi:hypothetical protein